MLATGTDAIAERQDWNRIRYADDTLMLCVQGATHWDALGHIFYEDKAYNGYDARLIDAKGLNVLGIEHSKNKMVGRGVLLDIARFRGVKWMADGESISNDELDKCAKAQNVAIGRGDFVIIRTGQMERCLPKSEWGGYAGGDAPGVKFENCYWCQEKEIAAICSDTWGVEVRPNETTRSQPALALGGHPRHGSVHGRDLLSQGAGRGLRQGRRLRVLLLRPAADHHRRHRLADQSAGDQVKNHVTNPRSGRVASVANRMGMAHASRLPRRFAPCGGGRRMRTRCLMMPNCAKKSSAPGSLFRWSTKTRASKERTPIYGEHPTGVQIATAGGRWLALMTAEGRPIPKTDEDRAQALTTMIAYTGRYRVENGKVITKVEAAWNQAWVGGEQVRAIRFGCDRLYIESPPMPHPNIGDKTVRVIVEWRRAKE